MTAGGRRVGAAFCMLATAAVLVVALGVGAAHGQEMLGEEEAAATAAVRAPLPEARVPSVSVAILGNGTVSVEHEVAGGDEARRVPLLGGGDGARLVDVRAVGAGDGGKDYTGGIEVSDDGSYAVVPAASGGLLVGYGLEGAMRLSEPSTYSWSFLYRATTSFTLPDGVDVAFVNGQAVHFTGARAFTCHGCQMELEFTVDEPRGVQTFEMGGGDGEKERIGVGVWTAAEVGPLAFDPASGSIAYEAGGVSDAGGRWVTLVVPPGLLGPPYRAEIGGENAPVTTFDAGGGMIGVSARPAEDGTVRIFGSAAAGAGAGPGAGDEKDGGESRQEEAGGDESGGASPKQGGAAADPWILAAAAGIAAAGAGAAAYLAWARRRQSPR